MQFVQKCAQKNVFDALFLLPSHLSIDCNLEPYIMILCLQQGHMTIDQSHMLSYMHYAKYDIKCCTVLHVTMVAFWMTLLMNK